MQLLQVVVLVDPVVAHIGRADQFKPLRVTKLGSIKQRANAAWPALSLEVLQVRRRG